VSGATTSPNKSKMEDGGHIEFRTMLVSPYWMNICAKSGRKMQHVRPRGYTYVTKKRNRKLIRMTSSVERREQIWVVLSDYTRYLNQFGTQLKQQTTIMAERAEFKFVVATIGVLNFETCQYLRGRGKDIDVVKSVSNDYN